MTLNIDLTPEEEERLRAKARVSGETPVECARRLLQRSLTPSPGAAQATRDLLHQWRDEDAADPSQSDELVQAELDEFKRRMNEPREAAGARPLFP
jgi:hypothetical protein